MKKIFVCILTLILSFSFIIPVNAKEITFEEVADIFVDFLQKAFEQDDEYEELKDQIKLGHTENTIYISIPVIELDMTYNLTFTYTDGIISFKYSGDRENPNKIFVNSIYDGAFIRVLIYSTGIAQGYTDEEMTDYALDIFGENYFDTNEAINYTSFPFNLSELTEEPPVTVDIEIEGEAIDTFSININEFRINTPIEEEPTTDTTPSDDTSNPSMPDVPIENPEEDLNDIENPQTGFMIPLVFVGLSLIFIIYSFKRKNIFKKI